MSYTTTIDRILEILKADTILYSKVAEWRFGQLPEQYQAQDFPAVYVTTAHVPEVERENYGVSLNNHESMPGQRVLTEYWIIIVGNVEGTPEDAQRAIYELRDMIMDILRQNIKLRDPIRGDDPLADFIHVFSQSRLTMMEGTLKESFNVMVRVTTHE